MRVIRDFSLLHTNIRRALLLLVLAVLVPVLGLLVFEFVDRFNDALDDETQNDLELARAISATFAGYVRDVADQQLAVGTALASLQPSTEGQAAYYLKATLADCPAIRCLTWANLDGKILASGNPAEVGHNLPEEANLREILANPARPYVISDLIYDESTGEAGFVITRGIYEEGGKLQSVVVARIDAAKLGGRTLPIDRTEQGRIAVFDRNGMLVYRHPEVTLTREQRAWRNKDPQLEEALAGHESSGRFISPVDNVELVTAYVPVKNLGWAVGASRPHGEVMKPLYIGLAINVGTMLVIAAVSIVLASAISRKVTRPLGRLQAQAVAIGQGNLDYRTEVAGIRELEDLSGVLNRMADSLKRAVADAEARAAENQVLARFPGENPSPVCRISADAVMIYANAASQPLLEAWACGVGKPVPAPIRTAVATAMTSGNGTELDLVAGDRTFSLVVAPVVEAGYANIYGRDVTERRKAQEELARSNKDLEQFAYVASHDLQEPLRIVAGYLQLLERRYKGQLDKDADDFINFAVDGVSRMQRLIQDLLMYSRLGTHGQRLAPTDCNKVIEYALANLRLAIDECGAVITHDPLPTVTADEAQLVQLMQNLVGNAIKFRGQRRPEIHISACPHEGRWLFAVKDNGIGIDAPYLERIFIIFQRLHGREKYPGTGIGLALCKRIVEHHGGRIWVESKVGEGSAFYFTL